MTIVVVKTSWVSGTEKLPTYRLDDADLGMGASFGNASVWVNTNTGAIVTRYAIGGTPANPGWSQDEPDPTGFAYVPLRPDGPLRRFELHPAYQRRSFSIARALSVEKTTFVPLDDDIRGGDPPAVYQRITMVNGHDRDQRVRIMAFARLRGSFPEDVVVHYDTEAKALVAWNRTLPATARALRRRWLLLACIRHVVRRAC